MSRWMATFQDQHRRPLRTAYFTTTPPEQPGDAIKAEHFRADEWRVTIERAPGRRR